MPKTIHKISGFLLTLLLISTIGSCSSGKKYEDGARNWKKTGKACNCPKLGMTIQSDTRTLNYA